MSEGLHRARKHQTGVTKWMVSKLPLNLMGTKMVCEMTLPPPFFFQVTGMLLATFRSIALMYAWTTC